MSDQSPSRLLDKIIIRVPEGMRDRIKRVADSNNRSVNAELLVLLDRTYPDETKLDEHLQDIADLVGKLPAEKERTFGAPYSTGWIRCEMRQPRPYC